MGFDNECIVDIQSLPGEYFCPVCRTLIYPNESLQAQCTHLYCKPCLAYVVATTHACPYDGYLVTEADAKPLTESNKELSESIGKVTVHCLYHRSGCPWQGTLAECTTHCTGCNYGNSPVVCNRCGTQIVHSQVQEHAQICPGVQPQTQQIENAHPQAVTAPSQASAQDPSATASTAVPSVAAAPITTAAVAASSSATTTAAGPAATSAPAAAVPVQAQVQGGTAVYPQAPSAEQWYQQQQLQYQQYYQQYPGYDPYQQQYQQYAQYQQQAHPQYMQPQMQAAPQHVVPGQQQPQPYMHPQPQPQPQSLPQTHAQPLPPQQPLQPQHQVAQPPQQQQQLPLQPHQQLPLQPHQQPHPQTQLQQHPQPHMQAQIPQMPVQPHVPAQQPQSQPPPHGQIAGQPHTQSHQLHPPSQPQARPPQLPGPPQHQQPVPPLQHPPAQMPYLQPHPQQQLRPQHPPPQTQQLAMQPQQHPQPHLQTVPPTQTSHPPSHAVSGHHSYPQPIAGAPQSRPMQMHPQQASMPPPYQQSQHPPQMQGQFPPQQPPQMRLPHAQMPVQVQQQPAMAPSQLAPPNLHPGQQQVQQPMHQAGMQPHAPQHGFPHSQAQGHLHPGQMQQQGTVPQQQIYQQQTFRPQGPAYMQHQVSGQPSPSVPAHQAQARPMVPNQGLPAHQAQARPMIPNQGIPHSGNQLPVSLATSKQGTSLPDASGQVAQSESGMTVKAAEGAESPDNHPDHVSNPKPTGDEDKLTMGVKEKGAQAESGSNEHPESEKGHESIGTKENVDGKMINQVMVKEEEVTETSNEETRGHDQRPDEKSIAQVKGEVAHPMPDGSSSVHPQTGADKVVLRPNLDNMQTKQMPGPGGLARGQSVQAANQTTLPAQERGIPHPGYHDRNASQFPQQYPPGRGPFPNQERFPPQQVPYGHPPNMADPTIVSQRPPAPDSMLPQPMQVHGPTMPPTQMRPSFPGHNYMESFPQQGQTPLAPEPFWQPPHAGGPGPGLPPPPAGVPLHHGFQQNTFHQQSMPPAGQSQTHMPPPNAGGARAAPGEPLTRSAMVGPPPGALDASSRMPGGGVGQSSSVNPMEPESYAIRRPGVHDSRQPELHRPVPDEHAPYGQPGALKMNGMPNKAYVGGMHDSTFGPAMGEDRFRSLPEERFKPFPEDGFNAPQDRFRPSTLDPGRRGNRREFEEDLKQFPRPAYLDEGPKIDGYMSDRAPQVSGGANLNTSRPLASYQSGPPFPPRSEGERERPVLHEHIVADHLNSTPEFGRHRMDGLPPLRSPGREYDGFSSSKFGLRGQSHREDFEERDLHGFPPRFKALNFPPPGPGYFGKDIPDGSGSLRSNQLRGLDGPDIPNIHPHASGAPGHGYGGSRSFSGIGEHGRPGGLPSHMRFGESGGFNGYFNSISREGEVDSFEQSRKRKPGSMGWCRICKIDCITVEGLDLHSQTREHQNMTMDLVLSIKQDNAKKQKLNSEKAISFEDENRSRKGNFENRGKRQ